MNLETLYEDKKVSEPLKTEKNIMLVVPSKDTDRKWFFEQSGLDPFEVAVTWPKSGVTLIEEIVACRPKVVVQIGDEAVTRRYPFIGNGPIPDHIQEAIEEAVTDRFVVLHHHDEFSLKDGLGTMKQLTKLLKKQRRSFCAITNHGSVGGWIKQYNSCMKAGIKPIFGMEAYVSDYRGDDPEQKRLHRGANHLILLARNETGYYNIIQIHNDAQLNGFYYSPRMDHAAAKKWGEGIIATSACMAGEIPQAVMRGDYDKAKEIYEFYRDCFDEFYIELQIIEFDLQREVNRKLIEFARSVGAPLILACDSHYLDPTHAETHDLLMYIRQGKTKLDAVEKDEDVWDFEVRNLFYRSDLQMKKVFKGGFVDKFNKEYPPFEDSVFTEAVFDEALGNTLKVARKIEAIKLDGSVKLPKLYADSTSILREKVNNGFKELGLNRRPDKQVYIDRLRYEFEVITKLGWADYFLIMEKIISMAKKEFYDEVGDWVIGYGRGSAAGCLVSWCLGLTDCDPIEYGLLFERFLDEGRPDPPDIDTDFHPAIRQRVKDKIVEMFGIEKTCSIGTYSTYKTKAAIIDVARALGYDVGEVQSVTKEMESLKSFETSDGEEEIVDKMDLDELVVHYPQLKEYFDKYPDVKVHAEIIRNQVKNMGKHAGGIIISDMDLRGKIPVQYDGTKAIISSWAESGNTAELSAVGLVKYDILGLNNLPVIADCVRLIEENRGIEIRRYEIPLDDKRTIRMETKNDLKGIFQFENPATKPIVDAVGVESLNDVSAVTSLLRPGPKDMGMHLEYAERKNGKPYKVIPCLEGIFKDTYGILVYQEQMMQISQQLCGFDGPMSNKLRKACGKKLLDLMVSIKAKFVEGAQPKIDSGEVTIEQVEELWDLIVAFARYGFNKSVDKDTKVITLDGVRRIEDVRPGQEVWCFNGESFEKTEVVALHDHGVLPAFEVTFDDGSIETCTINHKFLTKDGQRPLRDILEFNLGVYADAESKRWMDLSDLQRRIFDQEVTGRTQERNGTFSGRMSTDDRMCLRGSLAEETMRASSREMPSSNSCCKSESNQSSVGEYKESTAMAERESRGLFRVSEESLVGCGRIAKGKEVKVKKDDCNEQNQGSTRQGFIDGKEDVKPTRYTEESSKGFEKVERGKSREVCRDNKKSSKSRETIKGGDLAGEECFRWSRILKGCPDKMRGNKEADGFCQEELLDRSGRMLAFRNGIYEQEILVRADSSAGFDIEQRGRTEGCHPGSSRTGLLERLWKADSKRQLEDYSGASFERADSRSVAVRKVLHARFVGTRQMYDLEVRHESHNFVLASGLITSNSHAITYSMITTAELWLKNNYFLEYMTSLVLNTKRGTEKHGSSNILVDYLNYARKKGVEVLPPRVNSPIADFHIEDNRAIRFGLAHVKNVASAADNIARIAANKPFTNIVDFYERCVYETPVKTGSNAGQMRETRPNNKVVESLIWAGAFDEFGDRCQLLTEYNIARLGIPCPTDEEIAEEQEKIFKKGFNSCPGVNEPNADFSMVKGVSAVAEHITSIATAEPFRNMDDFHERCVFETEVKSGRNSGTVKETRPTKAVVEKLIYAGAFREFGDIREVLRAYHMAKNKTAAIIVPEDEQESLEIEMIGMCLSKEPLVNRYKALIKKHGWKTIGEHESVTRPTVFGRVVMIEPKNSKAGNPMYIVKMIDGLDSLEFFVFKGGMEYFRDSIKKGQLAAIPLSKFDDSFTRFFDDRGDITIIEE